MTKVNPIRTPQDAFAVMDDDQLACRAQEHDWPKLHPRKSVPKGARFLTNHDGSIQITETCRTCATTRTVTTMPGGVLDQDARYSYTRPQRWIVIPRGVMPPRAMKSQLIARMTVATTKP